MSLASFWVPPAPGMIAKAVSGKPIRLALVAMRMSQDIPK